MEQVNLGVTQSEEDKAAAEAAKTAEVATEAKPVVEAKPLSPRQKAAQAAEAEKAAKNKKTVKSLVNMTLHSGQHLVAGKSAELSVVDYEMLKKDKRKLIEG